MITTLDAALVADLAGRSPGPSLARGTLATRRLVPCTMASLTAGPSDRPLPDDERRHRRTRSRAGPDSRSRSAAVATTSLVAP